MTRDFRLFFFSIGFACCSFAAAPDQLFALGEPGFADADLRVDRFDVQKDGSVSVTATALDGAEVVGFRVTIPAHWRLSSPKDFPGPPYSANVRIDSIGRPTERFVLAVAKAYGLKIAHYEFTRVTLTAMSLEGDPEKVITMPIKLKLFFESGREDEYAEFYLNFDLPRQVVQFHEKGLDYRRAVIGLLTRKEANQAADPTRGARGSS